MLDSDIKSLVQAAIEGDLAAPRVPRSRVPKLKKVWGCTDAFNFLYGQRAGYYTGLAEGFMMERHRRRLGPEEEDEIFALIEPYTQRLRGYFAFYVQGKKEKEHRPAEGKRRRRYKKK
jgi:hypothetical protein